MFHVTFCQIVSPYVIYKQLTQRGDITFAANTILTCGTGTAACNTARTSNSPGPGTPYPTGTTVGGNNALNNNAYNPMSYVDADGTATFGGITSFSSSRAFLDLSNNPGCSVIEAYLTWGGNISTGTTNYSKRDSMYIMGPGATNYFGVKADEIINNTTGGNTYQCYKRITDFVKARGEGNYWGANVVASTGAANLSGGWAIVVIYGDNSLPLRNLSLFKRYANISTAAGPRTINLSGFYTPPSGSVNIKIGVFSLEGDQGSIGDSLKFNNIPVYNGLNYQDNIFNSSITINGVSVNTVAATLGSPAYNNTLGFDSDIITLDNSSKNYLTNAATTAAIKLTTGGDQYWPFMLSTAIDVFEPNIVVEKSWVDDNGGNAELGDVITYNLKVFNKGTDPATKVELIDTLYGAMDYVAGSSRILTGPNVGIKSDAIGDDQVDVNGNVIKFRLGAGANGTTGGNLGITAATDSVSIVQFKVKITDNCQIFVCRDSLVNIAYANFFGLTSGEGRSTLSSPNGLDAFGCPIQGPTSLKVVVPPCTEIPDTTLSVYCEPYALSNLTANRPGFTNFYNSSWGAVTNATANGTYYALKELYPGCFDTIIINFSSTGNCMLLPSNFNDINVNYHNGISTIKWTSLQENKVVFFEVERSIDGLHFTSIGIVNANGQMGSLVDYVYNDISVPDTRKIYYRIKTKYVNGDVNISNIAYVLTRKAAGAIEIVNIVPMPVVNESIVSLFVKEKGNFNIQVINAFGQVIKNEVKYFNTGFNNIKILKTNLKSGLYNIKIQTKEKGSVSKTFKIK